jgi:hypothetical protein
MPPRLQGLDAIRLFHLSAAQDSVDWYNSERKWPWPTLRYYLADRIVRVPAEIRTGYNLNGKSEESRFEPPHWVRRSVTQTALQCATGLWRGTPSGAQHLGTCHGGCHPKKKKETVGKGGKVRHSLQGRYSGLTLWPSGTDER